MNTIRMLAWGMLDLDDKRLTKQQRRTYIQRIRKELEPYNLTLQVGGSASYSNYLLIKGLDHQQKNATPLAYYFSTHKHYGIEMDTFGREMLREIERIEDTRRGNNAA